MQQYDGSTHGSQGTTGPIDARREQEWEGVSRTIDGGEWDVRSGWECGGVGGVGGTGSACVEWSGGVQWAKWC